MPWWEDIPLKTSWPVDVGRLSFDRENPRYSDDKGLPHETPVDIVRFLDETSDLGELLQSISTSGYVNIEPLVVMGRDDDLIVLEGNRRLAALSVLRDAEFAAEAGVSVPAVSPSIEHTLHTVTVYRVDERNDARDFIGFKHINGAHRWDSYAKARFATEWYREERAKGEEGLHLQDIARRMGDRHSTLYRMVFGYLVLEQAQDEGLFDLEDREKGRQFAFSHLYTALTRPGFREFLGLEDFGREADPPDNPVRPEFYANLRQTLLWLYGSESDRIEAVIRSQNPHIKQLSEVLEQPKACRIMLESGDLARAYSEVDTPQRQFERRIVEAHGAVEETLKKSSSFNGRDLTLLTLAEEISENSQNLLLIMNRKIDTGKAE